MFIIDQVRVWTHVNFLKSNLYLLELTAHLFFFDEEKKLTSHFLKWFENYLNTAALVTVLCSVLFSHNNHQYFSNKLI
jgi:hypothetical protein